MVLYGLRCAFKPSASATSAFSKLYQHFRGRGSPYGLQDTLSTPRPSCSSCSHDSAMDARLDTGGWLTLTRQGLSPCKRRQAFLARERCRSAVPIGRASRHFPRSSRVENWRAHLRWRVSIRALSIARWVHSSTIVTFPAPATSNAACGFPALRFPVRFMSRVMRPSVLGVLSAVAGAPGSC